MASWDVIPRDSWLPVAWSSAIGPRSPVAATVAGRPLALFRDATGQLRAFEDRCPHRGYPLSRGRVAQGALQCGYHGWRFGGDGACREIPALAGPPADRPERRATTVPAREAGGVAWLWHGDGEPAEALPAVEASAGDGALDVRMSFELEAALEDVAENILDVPHTAFLHGGLFRKPGRGIVIDVRVRRTESGIEAAYAGEPVPPGLLGRLLAPQGGVVDHADRFVMPAVAQVDYALGDRFRILATTLLCPVTESSTRSLHVLSLRPRALALAVLPILAPAAWWVLRQDAAALRRQSRNLQRFPEARQVSSEADVLGPDIRRMLELATKGEPPLPEAEWTSRIAP